MIIIAIVVYIVLKLFLSKQSTTTLSLIINPSLKHVLSNDIIIYNNNENEIAQIATVAMKFPKIWINQDITVDISKKKWISISLKFEINFKSLRIYSFD